MRYITIPLLILLMTCSIAFGGWITEFRDMYNDKGIDNAVEDALKLGISPDLIIENGLQLNNLNPTNLIKALYCAGALGEDIKQAADKWNLSELIVSAGYKKSLAECDDGLSESQPFTPVGTGTNFVSIDTTGGTPASPSTFIK